jgi:hypothetical protein
LSIATPQQKHNKNSHWCLMWLVCEKMFVLVALQGLTASSFWAYLCLKETTCFIVSNFTFLQGFCFCRLHLAFDKTVAQKQKNGAAAKRFHNYADLQTHSLV